MTRIRTALAGFVIALAGLWFLADTLPLASVGGRTFGVAFTQLSGILSIGMMSFATLLATRPRWLEATFDGLDKMYRLHKWLGIGGLAVGIAHWLLATGEAGRGRAGALAADAASSATASAQSWLAALHGPARGVAQPALFALIALVAIALIKLIPYRWFAKTHVLMTLVFLVLAFHSIVLMKAAYWAQPIGWAQ
jgi:predicted ferric reductase